MESDRRSSRSPRRSRCQAANCGLWSVEKKRRAPRSFWQLARSTLTLAKLNHRNIETVFEFGTQDGLDFLVMELISGDSLKAKHPRPNDGPLALPARAARPARALTLTRNPLPRLADLRWFTSYFVSYHYFRVTGWDTFSGATS